ncbi:MAG: Ig-like domain repeat protein, partial [Planctomycetes bacterium]|nr:Ig-like domain repeat protein [Planctomycetota bacterium]
ITNSVFVDGAGGIDTTNWSIPFYFGSGTHALDAQAGSIIFNGAITLETDAALEAALQTFGPMTFAGSTSNTLDGPVQIVEGTLTLMKSAGVAVGSPGRTILVGDGAGAASTATLTIAAPNQILDSAIVELASDGRILVNAAETIAMLRGPAGGMISLSQTLVCTGGGVHGLVSDGFIRGSGHLIVRNGTLNLKATSEALNPWTGEALADNGRFALNRHANRARAINGGTIGGIGTIANYLVADRSTIAPGGMPDISTSEVGTLTVGGDLAMNAGSRLQVQVLGGAGGTSDRLVVIGAGGSTDVALGGDGVDLNANGAQLVVSIPAGYVPSSTPMIIVDSPTMVAGRFAGLPHNAIISVPVPPGGATAALRIAYNGGADTHDITLTDITTSPGMTGTATAVTATSATSQPGQLVTFTATISESSISTPTGNIYFLVDGFTVGGGPLTVIGNSASVSFNSLTPGTHQITAMYNGDAAFFGSQGTVAHTVGGIAPPPPPAGGEDSSGGGSCGKGGGGAIAVAALMMMLRAFGWRRRC